MRAAVEVGVLDRMVAVVTEVAGEEGNEDTHRTVDALLRQEEQRMMKSLRITVLIQKI